MERRSSPQMRTAAWCINYEAEAHQVDKDEPHKPQFVWMHRKKDKYTACKYLRLIVQYLQKYKIYS